MLLVQQLEQATTQDQRERHPLTLVFVQKACTILQVHLARTVQRIRSVLEVQLHLRVPQQR
jgi:hypothetical protein